MNPEATRSLERGLLDINILPERYRPRKIRMKDVFPWLMTLALAGLLFPSRGLYLNSEARLHQLSLELNEARSALQAARPAALEFDALQSEIAGVEARSGEIEDALEVIRIQAVAWGDLLDEIARLAPDGVLLTGVSEADGVVTLEGTSRDYFGPLAYAASLESSGTFAAARVEALSRIPETEGAADEPAGSVTEASGGSSNPTAQAPAYAFQIRVGLEEGALDDAP